MTYFDIKISVNQWTFYKNGWINFLQAWEIHQYKYTFEIHLLFFHLFLPDLSGLRTLILIRDLTVM